MMKQAGDDILLVKKFVLKKYTEELDYLSATALEAELNGLLSGSFEKSYFYQGQRDCLVNKLKEYENINELVPPNIIEFAREKINNWTYEIYPEIESDKENELEMYRLGYQERAKNCMELLTGLSSFVQDDGPMGGSVKEYIEEIEKADNFATKQLETLFLDMGITVEELKQLKVPYWKEFTGGYHSLLTELFFIDPNMKPNPLPNFKKELEQLKLEGSNWEQSFLIEDKFDYLIKELNQLLQSCT